MTELAPDAVECSKLARTLSLRLTDRLTDGTIASSHYAAEDPKHSAASVDWGAGEYQYEGCLTMVGASPAVP